MKKILLALVILLSLGWIVYFSIETLGVSNTFDPVRLFNSEDKSILIINRQDEIKPGTLEELSGTPCEILYNDLKDSSFSQCFISLTKPHMLLLKKSGWSATDISHLFKSLAIKNLIESEGTFEVGSFEGRFLKQDLYIYEKGYSPNLADSWELKYDKKASAAIVEFNKENTTTDIYLKGVNRFDYITKSENLNSKQVNDEELFSRFVSGAIDTYHFYEREYFTTIDSVYSNGPLHEWLNNGFVVVTTANGRAIISDYILGQDPILNLRDKAQNDTLNEFSTPLITGFPADNRKYQIDYLEDLVVISEDKSIIDKLLADNKLGKTISNNEGLRERLFENLPHLVSERFVGANSAYSKAVYNNHILTAKTNQEGVEVADVKKQSYSMNIGARVLDFEVLSGEGNVVATDQSNGLTLFLGGIKEWSKTLPSKIEHVQVTDVYANEKQQVCAQTFNQVFLINQKGENIGNFPIKTEGEITSKVAFYRWKGSGYFVFGTDDGKAHVYDAQGREIRVVNAGLLINREIDAWSSQGRLFYGFTDDKSFHMYDADKRKMHRKFALNSKCIAGKVPNEIYQFGYSSGSLFRVDQKGTKTNLQPIPQAQLLEVFDNNKNPIIVVRSINEVKLFNVDGVEIGSVKLPFNEIADVDIAFMENGKTIIGVIDGLENNVYLYRVGGNLLIEKPIEGQQKVDVRISGSNKKITTIVDQFVVQYFEN